MAGTPQHMSGFFIVDKPSGITSYDVLREIKKWVKGVKIGYLGTLDPLATGVLPVLVGEGTKLAPFLESGVKVYEAILCIGVTTDTYDSDGRILRQEDPGAYALSAWRIEEVVRGLRGTIHQLPPMYSAVKQGGKRLYELARMGRHVERKPRAVDVYELQVTDISLPYIQLHVKCSKGTYIRSLAHDIGEGLGCGAHVTALRRTQSGPFFLHDALAIADIKELIKKDAHWGWLLPLSHAVAFLPALEIEKDDVLRIRQGQTIPVHSTPYGSKEDETMLVRVLIRGEEGLVAVANLIKEGNGTQLKPLRVFHDLVFTKRPPYDRDTIENVDIARRKVHGL